MLRRTLMTLAVASGLAALSAGTASAASTGWTGSTASAPAPAPAPAPATSADIAAGHAAATATLDTVGRFLAAGGQTPQGSAQQQETAAAALAPRLDSATLPVYYLNAAFVADPSPTGTAAPVANLAFLATDAVGTSGAHASVWTAKVGTAWKVVNIAQGSDETAYAGQARPGGTVFEEPQIGAWYQLLGGRVLPLDATARQSVGTRGMSLADYHKLVRSRYADKLPGSAYDRAGIAGGFQPRNPALGEGSGSGVNSGMSSGVRSTVNSGMNFGARSSAGSGVNSGTRSGVNKAGMIGVAGAVLAAGGVGLAGLIGYRRTRRQERAAA